MIQYYDTKKQSSSYYVLSLMAKENERMIKMEYDKNICPVVDVDGVIEAGKQFDLDITLPKDNRNVIYGIIRDCHKEPVRDAVVKLIEVIRNGYEKEERRPVSHTFTDKEGEFVFGPLCPDKYYEIQIWVDRVKHAKICATCNHEGACLKGVDIDCKKPHNPCKEYDDDYKPCKEHEDNYKPCQKTCKEYEDEHKQCQKPCKEHEDKDCKPCDKKCEEQKDKNCKPCDKKCEEQKDHECKPCEKKCENYHENEYDNKQNSMRPFGYRR